MKLNLKPKIYFLILNLYLISIGIGWICFHVYLRFLREIHSISLIELKKHITITSIIVILLIILIHLFIVIITSYNLYMYYIRKHIIVRPRKFYDKLMFFIDWIYWKPLNFLHDLIVPKIPLSGNFLFLFAQSITKYQPMQKTFIGAAIIFNFLPRIIIVLCLIIDLFVFKHMHYFLFSLGLLIFPLLYMLSLKILQKFAENNLEILNDILLVTPDSNNNLSYFFTRKALYNNMSESDFQEYKEAWKVITNLSIYVEAFKIHLYNYIAGINLFCSIIYAYSWTYYIYIMVI